MCLENMTLLLGKLVSMFAVERASPPFSTITELVDRLEDGSFTLYAERSTVPRFNPWQVF